MPDFFQFQCAWKLAWWVVGVLQVPLLFATLILASLLDQPGRPGHKQRDYASCRSPGNYEAWMACALVCQAFIAPVAGWINIRRHRRTHPRAPVVDAEAGNADGDVNAMANGPPPGADAGDAGASGNARSTTTPGETTSVPLTRVRSAPGKRRDASSTARAASASTPAVHHVYGVPAAAASAAAVTASSSVPSVSPLSMSPMSPYSPSASRTSLSVFATVEGSNAPRYPPVASMSTTSLDARLQTIASMSTTSLDARLQPMASTSSTTLDASRLHLQPIASRSTTTLAKHPGATSVVSILESGYRPAANMSTATLDQTNGPRPPTASQSAVSVVTFHTPPQTPAPAFLADGERRGPADSVATLPYSTRTHSSASRSHPYPAPYVSKRDRRKERRQKRAAVLDEIAPGFEFWLTGAWWVLFVAGNFLPFRGSSARCQHGSPLYFWTVVSILIVYWIKVAIWVGLGTMSIIFTCVNAARGQNVDGSVRPKPLTRAELDACNLVCYVPDPTERPPTPSLSGHEELEGDPVPLGEVDMARLPVPAVVLGPDASMCSICHDNFRPPREARRIMYEVQSLRQLPCGHVFHRECVDTWLSKRSHLCPYCNQSIRELLASSKEKAGGRNTTPE